MCTQRHLQIHLYLRCTHNLCFEAREREREREREAFENIVKVLNDFEYFSKVIQNFDVYVIMFITLFFQLNTIE